MNYDELVENAEVCMKCLKSNCYNPKTGKYCKHDIGYRSIEVICPKCGCIMSREMSINIPYGYYCSKCGFNKGEHYEKTNGKFI